MLGVSGTGGEWRDELHQGWLSLDRFVQSQLGISVR